MSKETEKRTGETGRDVSRRGLLEKAALVVGGAATAVVAARSALARPSDVSIDSSGRVAIDGTTLGGRDIESGTPGEPIRGTTIEARNKIKRCTVNGTCGGYERTAPKDPKAPPPKG
jgi:hypothetical protein